MQCLEAMLVRGIVLNDIKVPYDLSLTFFWKYLVKLNILTINCKDRVICYNMSNIQ